MKAVFGVVSLLIVLAVVGLLLANQLRTTTSPLVPAVAASATVREQAQQLEQRVREDLNQALQQGAARASAADQ